MIQRACDQNGVASVQKKIVRDVRDICYNVSFAEHCPLGCTGRSGGTHDQGGRLVRWDVLPVLESVHRDLSAGIHDNGIGTDSVKNFVAMRLAIPHGEGNRSDIGGKAGEKGHRGSHLG